MKIDLHVHASERSNCARSSEEEQIRAAIAAGLDGIVFTDHWKFMPQERLVALNHGYAPFRIFSGIEVTADGEDYLVLGIRSPRLEQNGWSYPELHAFVRQHGGWIALAHPYRYHPIPANLDQYRPDAIEVRSHNTPVDAQPKIRAVASRLNLPLLSNSDAHHADSLGKFYNLLTETPPDEASLLAQLRVGRFEGIAPA